MDSTQKIQYSDSKNSKFLSVSRKAMKGDIWEVVGIFLALLVIAAFLVIVFTMVIPLV